MTKSAPVKKSLEDSYVFMEKSIQVLEIGFKTNKNVILYGPGGHGKSELAFDFFALKQKNPYVFTMGTGTSTDRLFGGIDIPTIEKTGRIEYLVENSFMNYEYVIFEELFDAPDFILEQLKDILSSGEFRMGTQVFKIKTKFIVCCTNRTREEFSKNMSLKALMERFPLEHNVIWDNYTEHSYNKLLECKYGKGEVDPVIPMLLSEYSKNSIIISPRIAVVAYDIFDGCGPDALTYIAEFNKKPGLITESLKKYQATLEFRKLSTEVGEIIDELKANLLVTSSDNNNYHKFLSQFAKKLDDIRGLTVSDDLIHTHTELLKKLNQEYNYYAKKIQVNSFIED